MEDPILAIVERTGIERPVVTELIGPSSRGSGIEVVAAVIIVGLPGGIGSLEKQFRVTVVIADYKDDMAGAAGIGTYCFGEVYSRGGVGWHFPGCRDFPVTAIEQSCCCIAETGWLALR